MQSLDKIREALDDLKREVPHPWEEALIDKIIDLVDDAEAEVPKVWDVSSYPMEGK